MPPLIQTEDCVDDWAQWQLKYVRLSEKQSEIFAQDPVRSKEAYEKVNPTIPMFPQLSWEESLPILTAICDREPKSFEE